jgi:3-methyladenine DNA glycosylase AlkC
MRPFSHFAPVFQLSHPLSELLKDQFGIEVAHIIAGSLSNVWTAFPSSAFIGDVVAGYETLALLARAAKIAAALRRHLPSDYEEALAILLQSLGPRLDKTDGYGPVPFFYLPHTTFVGAYGLGHFEASMNAQYELTQRFTAEFSIRPFLEHHTEAALERLSHWAGDPNVHVRRLVSEGTRPRLPWAPRLRVFQNNPRPCLALLERLKDDPELYVRRSVANHLNDIGKDHPELLVETAERWQQGASPERTWIVRHALRSAVKRCEPGALRLLGYEKKTRLSVENASVSPERALCGDAVVLSFELANNGEAAERVMVDFRIFFVKANGRVSPKVFKLKVLEVPAGGRVLLQKKVSLAEMTTRKHYPGVHRIELLLNGEAREVGAFEIYR